jgi:hypothetical protein
VYSGSESFGLWGVTNGGVQARAADMGFISRVLRGNVSSRHLRSCGCVGMTMTLVPLRRLYITSGLV